MILLDGVYCNDAIKENHMKLVKSTSKIDMIIKKIDYLLKRQLQNIV